MLGDRGGETLPRDGPSVRDSCTLSDPLPGSPIPGPRFLTLADPTHFCPLPRFLTLAPSRGRVSPPLSHNTRGHDPPSESASVGNQRRTGGVAIRCVCGGCSGANHTCRGVCSGMPHYDLLSCTQELITPIVCMVRMAMFPPRTVVWLLRYVM